MKILAIGAHPDDIEIGCGGTLLYFQKYHNATVSMLLMTRGEGGTAENSVDREAEQTAACQILGIDRQFYGDLTDTAIGLQDAIRCIEDVVGDVDPDVVFTHYGTDTHQDHRVVADATISACRNRGSVLHYESISSQNFPPSMFVDVAEFIGTKCEAVASHISQEARLGLVDYVRTLATHRAYRTPLSCVEGFLPWKFFWR